MEYVEKVKDVAKEGVVAADVVEMADIADVADQGDDFDFENFDVV